MIDLHTHIIFGIDDGSGSIEESLAILREAQGIGMTKIALTPHFTVGEDVDEFLENRDKRVEALKAAAEENGIDIELKAGAEVYITDELFNETQLKRLTIGNGRVMLTEFKYHGIELDQLIDYIDEIQQYDIVPLIAHPERYSFLRKSPVYVNALITRGALLQVNAISLFDKSEEGRFARMLVENKSVSAIGSDVHKKGSMRLRALYKAADGEDYIKYITEIVPNMIFENSDEIFDVEAELL